MIHNLGDGLLIGLSSDKKPLPAQVARGNRFIELSSDYSKFTMFICDGFQWIPQTEFKEEYKNKIIDYNKNTIINLPSSGFGSSGGGTEAAGINVGITGLGIFKQTINNTLEFNNVDIGSTKLSIVQDSIGNLITFDVVEANLVLSNIGGSAAKSQIPAATAYEDEANIFTLIQKFEVGIKVKPITVPTTDASYGIYYSDSADTNKPKFKKPDGTVIDLTGAGSGVSLSAANTWTAAQKIDISGFPPLILYREDNTVGFGNGINISLQNSSSAEIVYGQYLIGIDTNTAAGSVEKGFAAIALRHTGALRTTWKMNPSGVMEFGDPTTRYVSLSPSGQTSSHVFTFPNADAQLAGSNVTNTFTAVQTFNNNILNIRNPADTFSYNIVSSAIAANRNLTLPLLTADDTVAVLGLAQTISGVKTFTATPKVTIAGFPQLTLYRTDNTVGFGSGLSLSLQNSSSAETIYAQLVGGINVNTASSEKGTFEVLLRHTGAMRTTFKLNPDGTVEWGDPTTRYATFAPTGLTSDRVFTFPNADAQLAGSDIANTFSAVQTFTATPKVTIAGFPQLTLYRTDNTVGFGSGIDISLQNSSNAEIVYAELIGGIDTNTAAGSVEKGFFSVALRHTGALRTTFKLNPDGTVEWGDPTTRYATFAPTGLSAARVFTFPNADAQLAGQNFANVFTVSQKFNSYLDIVGISVPANPASGTRRLFVDSGDGVLKVRTSGGTTIDIEAGGSGEVNTASNVGAGGVGVFKQKTVFDLEFKNINAASAYITIADDTGNNEVDIDVGTNVAKLNATQTFTSAHTYNSSILKIRNPADTFSYTIVGGAIAADRSITLPLLAGNDIMVTEAFVQTLTNKTIVAGSNTITGIVDANVTAHTTTKITTLSKSLLNTAIVYTDQTNTFGAFDQIFPSSRLLIGNPAATFNYTIVGAAIVAGRSITLPLLAGNDTMVTEAFTQTLTNKTIAAGSNTVTGIVDANISSHTSTKITITDKTHLNSAIVYTDQTNTFGAFNQIFPDSRLLIQNPAATFSYTIVPAAIAANRNLNLPLITGTDTVAVLGLAQTFTAAQTFNSSMLKLRNPADTFSYTIVAAAIAADRTLNLPLITGTDTLGCLGLAQTFTAAKTFNDSLLKLRNPADTFSYTIVPSAIAADRNLTIPLLTASDTIAVLGLTNIFSAGQQFDNFADYKQISAPANPSANYGRMYLKQIDSNNDGLFMLIKKANGFVEVQII